MIAEEVIIMVEEEIIMMVRADMHTDIIESMVVDVGTVVATTDGKFEVGSKR